MSRRRLTNIGRVAVSVALLVLLFRTVGLAEVAAVLGDAEPLPLAGAILLYCVLGTYVRGCRWRTLIVSLGHPISLHRANHLFLVGTFFSQLLPTGIGGDVVRALTLAGDGLGRARAFSTVVVDRALGILPLLATGLVAVLLAPGRADRVVSTALLLFGGAGLGALVLLFQMHRWRHGLDAVPGLGWLLARPGLARFADSFAEYDSRALVVATLWALVFTLLLVGANALLGRAVGIDQAGLADWAVVVPLASLSLLLPSVGGWGVREWTYVGLLGALQPPVGAEQATAVSMLFGGLNLLLAAVGGVLLVVAPPKGAEEARAAAAGGSAPDA